ncbi:MAG: fibronectin type III domain-containing protein [Vicinamibacterales bacterium]
MARFLVALWFAWLPTSAEGAPSNVSVSRVNTQVIGRSDVSSSSALLVAWTPAAADATHHFEIVATEGVQGTAVAAMADSTATSLTLTGLKSNTEYAIVVKACGNDACSESTAAAAVPGSTDAEYWQLRGTGNRVDTLIKIVSDGNARLSATLFGPDAGAMANHVQLYYGPFGQGRTSPLTVATTMDAADATKPDTFLSFTSRSGVSGLTSPSSPAPLVAQVATGQGVPVARELGGFVRLFFEAQGADGKTRILSLDSQDGYYGLDFNTGASGVCSTAADYSAGGGCVPTVAIGVEGDATNANSRITNARQFKLGWPTLDSPHWDGAAGRFMVFTSDRVTGCSAFQQNHGYAMWDGSAWQVQYQDNGCPKLFTSAQAAFPMHIGGVRYKMYYGDPSVTTGRGTSNLPFLGPKKLIYADGRLTGAPDVVDFEDWEPQASAREVVFLWPNGDQLDAGAEGYIDDYHFLAPTRSLDLQVMYVTITDGAIAPFSAAAILRNP